MSKTERRGEYLLETLSFPTSSSLHRPKCTDWRFGMAAIHVLRFEFKREIHSWGILGNPEFGIPTYGSPETIKYKLIHFKFILKYRVHFLPPSCLSFYPLVLAFSQSND